MVLQNRNKKHISFCFNSFCSRTFAHSQHCKSSFRLICEKIISCKILETCKNLQNSSCTQRKSSFQTLFCCIISGEAIQWTSKSIFSPMPDLKLGLAQTANFHPTRSRHQSSWLVSLHFRTHCD